MHTKAGKMHTLCLTSRLAMHQMVAQILPHALVKLQAVSDAKFDMQPMPMTRQAMSPDCTMKGCQVVPHVLPRRDVVDRPLVLWA